MDDTAVRLFYSYAHEDAELRDELQGHLKILERKRLIAPWHDRRIDPGRAWDAEIDEHLRRAELVLLLVSADFIASDYIMGKELAAAMAQQVAGRCQVVWIKLRPLDLQPGDEDIAPFLKLQGLPPDLRPVTSWPQRDEAWVLVAQGLRRTVEAIRTARAPLPPSRAARPGLGTGPRDGPQVPRRGVPDPRADPSAAPDPSFDQLLARIRAPVLAAARERQLAEPDPRQLDRDAQWLIDRPGAAPRVLWVDDRPENNRHERAALARMQIEVVCATGTDEALALLRPGAPPFDMIVSDWHRGAEGPDAALGLLRRLRDRGSPLPVVIYHAAFDARSRASRRERALAIGAFGEAVLPQELIGLVVAALRRAGATPG
jgi:CheY-like chemotaxis protein